MVSLLNNGGIRFYLSQNDPATQYPCYLYDPYSFTPNLNRMDYQQTLLYPQTQAPIEPKKPKKSKKKTGNEKAIRENTPLLEETKEDLITWLKSLSLEERLEVFSIKNGWLAIAFVKMYKRWTESNDTVFALLMEENKNLSCEKNIWEFGDLDKHFYCRRATSDKHVHIEQEREINNNVSIYDDTSFYDTIVFKEELLQNIDRIIELFETISDGSAFARPCKMASDHNTKGVVFDTPLWFNSTSFHTLAEWIVSSFEKAIWARYFQTKKISPKKSLSFEALDFKMTLKYKKSLIEFWKGLDKSKKKKLVSVANETYKYLTFTNPKIQPIDNSREINQGLKALYESTLFAQAKGTVTHEAINTYFSHLLEEENEAVVVETILMTSLDQFGHIPDLICRKLAHKLRNMLSEKIAADLILNEEREKKNINNKKKVTKNKKSKKAKHSVPAGDAAPMPEQEKKAVSPKDSDSIACDPTDQLIKDQQNGKEETKAIEIAQDRKLEEAFVNNIADVATNDSETEEKNELESKIFVEDNDKKQLEKIENTCNYSVGRKVEADYETLAVQASDKIDEGKEELWFVFEDMDKKLNQSQKKKQKRKQKKKNDEEFVKLDHNIEQDQDIEEKETRDSDKSSSKEDKEEMPKEIPEFIREEPPSQNKKEQKDKNSSLKQENPNKRKEFSEKQKNVPMLNKRVGEISITSTCDKKESIKPVQTLPSLKESAQSEISSALTFSEKSPKESWRNDTSATSARSIPTSSTTVGFDEGGFIEVKAKKKPEKEKKPKAKKEPKDGWRKKKEKQVPEKKKPLKENLKPKMTPPPTEVKKDLTISTNVINPEKPLSIPIKPNNVIDKNVENDNPSHKNNFGISKIIPGPALNSKIIAPKPLKKTTQIIPLPESSNNSEGDDSASTTRKTSHSSHSSHNQTPQPYASSCQEPSSGHSHRSHKSFKSYHPLSISSPPLDLEAVKISKVKEYASDFFDKKFGNDIYKHVAELTEGANKMMDYRILAYKRLDFCIASLFPNMNVKTKIFGSCATGLSLTSSDVDIAVSGIDVFDRYTLNEYIVSISNTLKQFKWVTFNKPILTANVPILKLEIDLDINFDELSENCSNKQPWSTPLSSKGDLDVKSPTDMECLRIRVDLSLESMRIPGYNFHLGYKTTDFVMKMLQKYESLYIVTMVLKEFLDNRKLLNTYAGGISSYCLVIMVVALFQKFGDEGYMASIKRFFNFYGEVFKPECTGISLLDSKDPFFTLNHSYETAPLWIIEHSTFAGKNIGQGSYFIKGILHEFEKASKTVEYLRQKFEETAVQHQGLINSIEDIGKIEDDPEFKSLLGCNILELFMKSG